MANVIVTVRAWQLLQQMEVALQAGNYDQVRAYGEAARTYDSFPTGTDSGLLTAWFSTAVDPGNPLLGLIVTAQTVTGAAAPVDGDIAWVISDGRSTTITNKSLTTNVVTLTTAGLHRMLVGQKVTVAGVGAPFDGPAWVITAVTSTTFSYAVVNANVVAVASAGTIVLNGIAPSLAFGAAGSVFVAITVKTGALSPVTFGRFVKVPFGS